MKNIHSPQRRRDAEVLISAFLLFTSTFAFAQLPTNNIAPSNIDLTVGTNGALVAPANFFTANSNALKAVIGGTGSGTDTNALHGTNNLSDLTNAAAARTNLGLGTAATSPVSAFQPASGALTNLAANNAGGLTNVQATNLTTAVAGKLYVRAISPSQSPGTYWPLPGEGMWVQASTDLRKLESITGTNFVFLDPDGKGPHDPSLMWNTTNQLWYVAYTKQSQNFNDNTKGAGLASSPDLVHWTYVNLIVLTNTAVDLEAPEWFQDSDGSMHLLYQANTTFLTGATFIWMVDFTDQTFTNTANPRPLIAAGTSWLQGNEDAFMVKSNTTYCLYVMNQATSVNDLWTNSTTSSLFTRAKTNILNGPGMDGCDVFYDGSTWWFLGASMATGAKGRSEYLTASTQGGWNGGGYFTAIFNDETPVQAFGQGTVCVVPTNQIVPLELLLAQSRAATRLIDYATWLHSTNGSLIAAASELGPQTPTIAIGFNPNSVTTAPYGLDANGTGYVNPTDDAAAIFRAPFNAPGISVYSQSGAYGAAYEGDSHLSGGHDIGWISESSTDGNAGASGVYDHTDGQWEWQMTPGGSGHTGQLILNGSINLPVTNTTPATTNGPKAWVTITVQGTSYKVPLYQ